MAKGKKRDSDEYEEDEEDEDDDMEEDDYVPSPRDRKAKSKTGSIEPSMEPLAGDKGGAAAAGEAEPQLVLIEELWVTCDRCDKWRLLPPGSIKPSENIPWFCALNPDMSRNRCDAPEQAWNEAGSVDIADKLPGAKKKAAGRPKSAPPLKNPPPRPSVDHSMGSAPRGRGRPPNSSKAAHGQPMTSGGGGGGGGAIEKARIVPMMNQGPLLPPPRPAPAIKSAPKTFSTIAEELRALITACNQILTKGGSVDPTLMGMTQPSSHVQLASNELSLPLWVWAGLHFYAPAQAKAASKALDVLTATEYGDQALAASAELGLGGPAPSEAQAVVSPSDGSGMKAQEANARLMLMAAASVTLPRVEAALIYYPLPKRIKQSFSMMQGGSFEGQLHGGGGMGLPMSPDALSPEMLSMMTAMLQQSGNSTITQFGSVMPGGISPSMSSMQLPMQFDALAPPPPPLMSEAELNQMLQSLAPPPPPPPLAMDQS